MPTTSEGSANVSAIHFYSNGTSSSMGYVAPLYYRETYKELSIRRVRPTDLFAGCTSRTFSRSTWLRGLGKKVYPDGSYDLAPTSYWLGMGVQTTYIVPEVDGAIRSRIKSQNLNLAQTLAEYRQTSKMFSSIANDVFRTFRSLRSGRAFGDFVRILQAPRSNIEKEIANRWLQYQYGIRPLISDLYGSIDALATKIRSGFWNYGIITRKLVQSGRVTNTNGTDDYVDETWTRKRYRYKISDATLKQLAQIGITNPALLVWELIPYSFVIDWLFPVGKFLESLDSLVGVSNLQYIATYKRHYTSVTQCYGGKSTYEVLRWNRTFGTELALPKFAYKPSTSLKSVANGLALLKQLALRH